MKVIQPIYILVHSSAGSVNGIGDLTQLCGTAVLPDIFESEREAVALNALSILPKQLTPVYNDKSHH